MSHFIDLGVNDGLKTPLIKSTYSAAAPVVQLLWHLDETITQAIQRAKALSLQLGNSLLLKRKAFTDFGKRALTKEIQVNPDTFQQMAIQLAYQRLHHKAGTLKKSNKILQMHEVFPRSTDV